jgi:hypothetical protein
VSFRFSTHGLRRVLCSCAAARLLPQADAGALLANGIYTDFPAELRLQPDGETLTPYPPLISSDLFGPREAAAIRSKISNTIDLRPVFVRIFAASW